MITYDKLLASGGHWVAPADPGLLEIRSPHDRRLLGLAAQGTPADQIDKAVSAAAKPSTTDPGAHDTEARQEVVARFTKLAGNAPRSRRRLISAENGAPLWFTSWVPRAGPGGRRLPASRENFGWEERLVRPGCPRPWCAVNRSGSSPRFISVDSPYSAGWSR